MLRVDAEQRVGLWKNTSKFRLRLLSRQLWQIKSKTRTVEMTGGGIAVSQTEKDLEADSDGWKGVYAYIAIRIRPGACTVKYITVS